jgi:hypothetical protein
LLLSVTISWAISCIVSNTKKEITGNIVIFSWFWLHYPTQQIMLVYWPTVRYNNGGQTNAFNNPKTKIEILGYLDHHDIINYACDTHEA